MRPSKSRIKGKCEVRVVVEPLEDRRLCSATAGVQVQPNTLFTPNASGGSSGYSPAQIRHAYGFDQVKFGAVVGDGAGQTIAIVDAYSDPNLASDLHAFDLQYGLSDPPSLRTINQSGGTSTPSADAGWAMEIALDVEWAHAIAPKANILLVEASSASLGDLMAAVNTARNGSGVSVVSMSWGTGEFWQQTQYDSIFTTPAGHQGVTFVAASGDNGSWYGPQWPSSSKNVLAVGGTSLAISNAAGTYSYETGWSGSGGGISRLESAPAWQSKVQTTGARTTPDVAFNANPATGFAVYDSFSYAGHSGWWTVGGTSAGAPQWAALVAIADQGRAIGHLATLDGSTQTLPGLYALSASAFHDITLGRSSFFISAHPGYDGMTGLGTPEAASIIAALAGYASGTSAATTATSVASSTNAGRSVTHADAPMRATTFFTLPAQVGAAGESLAIFATGAATSGSELLNSSWLSAAGEFAGVVGAARSGETAAGNVLSHWPHTIVGAPLAIRNPDSQLDAAIVNGIHTATGVLRSYASLGTPEADFALASAATRIAAPIAYNFVRLEPGTFLADAGSGLIREMTALSSVSPAAGSSGSLAWWITGTVLAADAVLIARAYVRRRKAGQSGGAPSGEIFSARPISNCMGA